MPRPVAPLALFAALLAPAAAPGAEPLDGGHPLALVQRPAVQKELGLSDEQVAQVKPLLGSGDGKALDKALDAKQRKRLAEIVYQARGGAALADPDLAEKLGLSDAQARTIGEIARDRERDLDMVLRVTRFRGPEARRNFMLDWRKGAADKMLAELSGEQKKKFEALKGKKFAGLGGR